MIHLVCDEETGSALGSGYLDEHELIDPAALAMLTPEQSGEAIWHAAKGALSVRVTLRGRPAHVGQAFNGLNSFQHMLHIARPLEKYAQQMARRHSAHPIGEGGAPGTMIVIGGQCGGGSNFNVVPARSWFTVDGRYNPEEDLDSELERITGLVNDAATSRKPRCAESLRCTRPTPHACWPHRDQAPAPAPAPARRVRTDPQV